MARTVFIFVNGILTFPGASNNWTGRAVTWTHVNTPHRAEKVEYFTGPMSRVLGQRRRARKLLKTLSYYQGWKIHLVGHSNGCDVILDALRNPRLGDRYINIHLASIQLISGACTADFDTNGLNLMLEAQRVQDIAVYIATEDWPLRLAGSIPGWILGYGTLGRTGPRNAISDPGVITAKWGHSDWFREERFDHTMEQITEYAA